MSRRHDLVLVRYARLDRAARGIEDSIHLADKAVLGRHRAELPRLWAAIDRLRAALSAETDKRGFNWG
jgi:hypothetical protein